jgi:hypothetical protein
VKQVTHADALADKMLHNAQVAASTRRTAVLERHGQWQQWAVCGMKKSSSIGVLNVRRLILQQVVKPLKSP